MSTLDLRPGSLDLLVYPGNDHAVVLTWPSSLAGRTFAAVLDAAALTVAVSGAVMTVTMSDTVTAAVVAGSTWSLRETTADGVETVITGRVLALRGGAAGQASQASVSLATGAVAVTAAGTAAASSSGPAGGVLSGAYPNPGFAVDMATQGELDAKDAAVVHLTGAEQRTGALTLQPSSASGVPAVLKGAAAQTGDLLQAQDSSGAVLSRLDKAGHLAIGGAPVAGVPLVANQPAGLAAADLAQFVGSVRDVATGKRYRLHLLGDPHLHMNTAVSINGLEWGGADGSVPPPATHDSTPAMLAITNDTTGPAIYVHGNDTGRYLRFVNNSGVEKLVLDVAPSSAGGGVRLGLGDVPISTLTLSDKDDNANLPAITIRHAAASARLAVTGTATIDLSSNYKAGENAFSEWAIVMGLTTDDIRFYRAPTPGGARAEIARMAYAGLRMASGKELQLGAAGETRFYDDGNFVFISSHNCYFSTGAVNALVITNSTGAVQAGADFGVTGKFGANGTAPIAKPTVTGSRAGNAALASVLTALASYGLLVDSSS